MPRARFALPRVPRAPHGLSQGSLRLPEVSPQAFKKTLSSFLQLSLVYVETLGSAARLLFTRRGSRRSVTTTTGTSQRREPLLAYTLSKVRRRRRPLEFLESSVVDSPVIQRRAAPASQSRAPATGMRIFDACGCRGFSRILLWPFTSSFVLSLIIGFFSQKLCVRSLRTLSGSRRRGAR